MTTTKPTYRPTAVRSLFSAHSSQAENHAFSSKERDVETGLSYFGARYYSSDLSIWLSVDPMSGKYPSLSPYVYCANNPVKLVDPNGEEIVILGGDGESVIYSIGMDYSGNDPYIKDVVNSLNDLATCKSTMANSVVSELVNSQNIFSISYNEQSDFSPSGGKNPCISATMNLIDGNDNVTTRHKMLLSGKATNGSGGIIHWNNKSCVVKTTDGVDNIPTLGLFHELSHGIDANNGIWDNTKINGMKMTEWNACSKTNQVRKDLGYPMQTMYGGQFNYWDGKYSYLGEGISLFK